MAGCSRWQRRSLPSFTWESVSILALHLPEGKSLSQGHIRRPCGFRGITAGMAGAITTSGYGDGGHDRPMLMRSGLKVIGNRDTTSGSILKGGGKISRGKTGMGRIATGMTGAGKAAMMITGRAKIGRVVTGETTISGIFAPMNEESEGSRRPRACLHSLASRESSGRRQRVGHL